MLISDWSSDVCSSDLADEVEDQDDERLLRRFEPESEHGELDQHRADRDRVITVERRVGGPEQMRAEQQREHQPAEQARPAPFETEDEKLVTPAARAWGVRHRLQSRANSLEAAAAAHAFRHRLRPKIRKDHR